MERDSRRKGKAYTRRCYRLHEVAHAWNVENQYLTHQLLASLFLKPLFYIYTSQLLQFFLSLAFALSERSSCHFPKIRNKIGRTVAERASLGSFYMFILLRPFSRQDNAKHSFTSYQAD